MNRQNRLLSAGRLNALTRKQELESLRRRKDTELAEQVSARLEPFIVAEIERQLTKALEDRDV